MAVASGFCRGIRSACDRAPSGGIGENTRLIVLAPESQTRNSLLRLGHNILKLLRHAIWKQKRSYFGSYLDISRGLLIHRR
jgi:hypothetical protein